MEVLGQHRGLVAPGVPELRETVQQKPQRPFALFHLVQPDAVGGGKAMSPRLGCHKDFLSALPVDSAISQLISDLKAP